MFRCPYAQQCWHLLAGPHSLPAYDDKLFDALIERGTLSILACTIRLLSPMEMQESKDTSGYLYLSSTVGEATF